MYKSQEWRPNDWKNHFTKEHMNLSPDADMESSIYESGADAIIQALYDEIGKKKIWLDKADDGHILICVEQ